MKIVFALINLAVAVNIVNNLGLMRSKGLPDKFHGSTVNTGRLASVAKRTVLNMDNHDIVAGCRLARTGRGRKRLICPNAVSKHHFEKKYGNFLFKNIQIAFED